MNTIYEQYTIVKLAEDNSICIMSLMGYIDAQIEILLLEELMLQALPVS